MRKGFLRLFVLASVAAGVVCAGPVLTLEPTIFEWGRQAENKENYPFSFTVKNTGDEELQITRVRPGCSCTQVDLKKQTLAPGETTEMKGVLSTKGIEGTLQKGIILTSNDPVRQTTVANLSIRFPINGQGLRLRGAQTSARLRQGALWAYLVVENCEPDTAITIEAMELPAGWDCPQALPMTVKPEDRITITLNRPLGSEEEPEPFDNLPLTLVTDCAKTPRIAGTLSYKPDTRSTAVSTAAGDTVAQVRWPMAKPVSLAPAPVTAPTPMPAQLPAGTDAAPAPGPTTAAPAGTAPAP
jgi:hypothetical protein